MSSRIETNSLLNLLDAHCAICLSLSQNPSLLIPCGHLFCLNCLHQWIRINPTCPLCKSKIDQAIFEVRDDLCFKYFDVHSNRTRQAHARHSHRRRVYAQKLDPVDIYMPRRELPRGVIYNKHAQKLKDWILRDLVALFQTDNLEHLDVAILNVLDRCGSKHPDTQRVLQQLLGEESASLFLRDLELFIASRKSVEQFDHTVQYKSSEIGPESQDTFYHALQQGHKTQSQDTFYHALQQGNKTQSPSKSNDSATVPEMKQKSTNVSAITTQIHSFDINSIRDSTITTNTLTELSCNVSDSEQVHDSRTMQSPVLTQTKTDLSTAQWNTTSTVSNPTIYHSCALTETNINTSSVSAHTTNSMSSSLSTVETVDNATPHIRTQSNNETIPDTLQSTQKLAIEHAESDFVRRSRTLNQLATAVATLRERIKIGHNVKKHDNSNLAEDIIRTDLDTVTRSVLQDTSNSHLKPYERIVRHHLRRTETDKSSSNKSDRHSRYYDATKTSRHARHSLRRCDPHDLQHRISHRKRHRTEIAGNTTSSHNREHVPTQDKTDSQETIAHYESLLARLSDTSSNLTR